jgi:hypothetical protein
MVVNILITNFVIISTITALFIKLHVPKLLSKTILQSKKINMFLRLPELS